VKGERAWDLSEHAAKLLLSKLSHDPSTIDCLIMVTQTPDYFEPATSCVLHGRLGLGKN
jgi:3-oxoacyl-[acyl-carrier-protein] synthase-3